MRLRLGRRGILRFVLSVPVAFALVSALATTGAVTTCDAWLSVVCTGPSEPPPPPPTPTPAPDWTWVENLPSPSVVSGRTYTARIEQCTDVLCVTTTWDYFETVIVNATPYDPCCMGADIYLAGAFVAMTSGVGYRTPVLFANGTIYRYDGFGNNYDRGDWTAGTAPNASDNCPPILTQGYEASISGCTIYAISIDGANATDRFGLDEEPGTDIPISGYTQSVPRKWY